MIYLVPDLQHNLIHNCLPEKKLHDYRYVHISINQMIYLFIIDYSLQKWVYMKKNIFILLLEERSCTKQGHYESNVQTFCSLSQNVSRLNKVVHVSIYKTMSPVLYPPPAPRALVWGCRRVFRTFTFLQHSFLISGAAGIGLCVSNNKVQFLLRVLLAVLKSHRGCHLVFAETGLDWTDLSARLGIIEAVNNGGKV